MVSLGGMKREDIKEEWIELEMVCKGKLRDLDDFHERRYGDHLIFPFECNLCTFRKLRGVDSIEGVSQANYFLNSFVG